MQNDGCLNFVDENDEVLISGFGRRGKAKGDIPGVRFKIVKVSGVGLLALWKEKKVSCEVRLRDDRLTRTVGEASVVSFLDRVVISLLCVYACCTAHQTYALTFNN